MDILIASDGTLDAEAAAATVQRLYEEGDTVTAMTVLHFPREFLESYGQIAGVQEVTDLAEAVGPGILNFASGAIAAERLATKATRIDVPAIQYFEAAAANRLDPLLDALKARGFQAEKVWYKTEGRTASEILQAADKLGADLLIIGSHGYGRFEGLLGATGTKIVRRAESDVLILKTPPSLQRH